MGKKSGALYMTEQSALNNNKEDQGHVTET